MSSPRSSATVLVYSLVARATETLRLSASASAGAWVLAATPAQRAPASRAPGARARALPHCACARGAASRPTPASAKEPPVAMERPAQTTPLAARESHRAGPPALPAGSCREGPPPRGSPPGARAARTPGESPDRWVRLSRSLRLGSRALRPQALISALTREARPDADLAGLVSESRGRRALCWKLSQHKTEG